jgi:transcriptional regulator with PAS, ATPase and Fis domain
MNLLRGVCVNKEGKKFWVSTNRSVISLKSKPAILAILRDITEDMLQERSIQEVTERLQRENIKLRSCIKERYRFGNIVGKSLPMQNIYELILKAAASSANVIILGESGTGKELVARAIHEMSARADKAFVPVNCGAIPENLVESEFFGHRKGAFTGAHIDKTGYLHTADGGTLFLDEVGELGLNMQVKLLRALETGEYAPIGDTQFRRSDARIISATNRDFAAMVSKGLIREDFYYRISVIPIVLPTLRDKKEDIPLLIEHFLQLYSKQGKIPTIPGKIVEVLYNYDWPGNVRELQSVIQRYLAVGNFDFLRLGDKTNSLEGAEAEVDKKVTQLRVAKADFEKRYILTALKQNRWHRAKVAAELGIDPKTLYTKMKKIGLS